MPTHWFPGGKAEIAATDEITLTKNQMIWVLKRLTDTSQ